MASPDKADLIGNRYGHLPYRRRVITPSTASTGLDLTPAESGAFIVINDQTTLQVRLPKISSLALGLTYDIMVRQQETADSVTIMVASSADSSAALHGVWTSNSTISTAQEASPETTQFDCYCTITALTTVVWLFEGSGAAEADGGGGTADNFFSWTTGSTST